MKIKRLLIYTYFFICTPLLFAQSFNAGSYNIRNDNNYDKEKGNGWDIRKKYIADLIQYHEFDILGTQEGLSHQLENLKNLLPDFDYIGVGRDDGEIKGEFSAIFYNKNKFKLIDSGSFWLSEDSSRPNIGWDAACVRICTWGKFKTKDKKKVFFFFNVHTDHVGVEARRKGNELIVAKIKEIAKKAPVILSGDFNDGQNSTSYHTIINSQILKDSYTESPIKYANSGNYNAFDPTLKTTYIIDHIFITEHFKVSKYAILTDMYWSESVKPALKIPSDHYPVLISVSLN